MNDKSNKSLAETSSQLTDSPIENGKLINATIVQILVERNNPEEIKDLMRYELDYNREKLEIIREHARLHPDGIEDRKTKRFGRIQYGFLAACIPAFIYVALVSPIAIAVPLVTAVLFIIVAIALNGRDRENDGQFLLKILEKITGSKK